MARLPQPGGDEGNWGDILNDYLSQSHKGDGTLKDNSVTSAQLAPGAVTKADVGLGNVDNTSDSDKPISSAVQAALNDLPGRMAAVDADENSTFRTQQDARISAAIVSANVATTKRVTMSLGAPRNQNAAGALSNWAERIPIRVPRLTTRWRLRVANRVLRPTASPLALTQQFSIGDIYLGTSGSLTADGRPQGTWSSAPAKVLDGALLTADGTDWVSPWVEDADHQFGPDFTKQVGITLSGTLNGNGSAVTSSHYGHRSTTAGINAVNHTQLTRSNFVGNTLALDKRIEYEFTGTDSVGLLIGASGDEGYNTTVAFDGSGGYEVMPVFETWPGVYGLRNKVHWVNAAIVGATQTPYLDRTALTYTRFDLATTVPDFAVISLGGNSVLASASLATIKSEISTVVEQVRHIGINRIYLATVLPVGLSSGDARETLRTQLNDWLRTNPFLADGIVDVDLILRDPTNKLAQSAEFITSDNIHPNHAGYIRWGMHVPVIH